MKSDIVIVILSFLVVFALGINLGSTLKDKTLLTTEIQAEQWNFFNECLDDIVDKRTGVLLEEFVKCNNDAVDLARILEKRGR